MSFAATQSVVLSASIPVDIFAVEDSTDCLLNLYDGLISPTKSDFTISYDP